MARHDQHARREAILQALRAGNTRTASAAAAGVSRDIFYKWLASSSTFFDAVTKAEAEAEVAHVANIAQAATMGNWTASAWWLERRRHQEWGRKDRVEIIQTVRRMAAEAGLSDAETAAAIAEAERYLKETGRAARA